MPYRIGQKVCLWLEIINDHGAFVAREVVVEVCDSRVGVRTKESRRLVMAQSLLAVTPEGVVYEKHWDFWPEDQTGAVFAEWTPRVDGVGARAIWTPKEAVFAYNHLRLGHKGRAVRHKDCRGMVILPKGDVEYCPRHDHYMYRGEPCFQCWLERVVLKVK